MSLGMIYKYDINLIYIYIDICLLHSMYTYIYICIYARLNKWKCTLQLHMCFFQYFLPPWFGRSFSRLPTPPFMKSIHIQSSCCCCNSRNARYAIAALWFSWDRARTPRCMWQVFYKSHLLWHNQVLCCSKLWVFNKDKFLIVKKHPTIQSFQGFRPISHNQPGLKAPSQPLLLTSVDRAS